MNGSLYRSCLVLVVIASLGLFSAAARAQQPNIVFIVVDDAGFADFGFMGSTEIPTPNLDALAGQGVTFTQSHTGQACSPSRGAFLTGSFHNRFGYEANLQNTDDPINEHVEGLPNSAVTMFERLKSLGYSTSVTGKWHVGGTRDIVQGNTVVTPGNIPIRQGVDLFEGFQAGGGLQRMYENPDGTANITNYSAGTHWTEHWTDNTIGYIDDHYQDANPFFIYTSYNDPHSPIQATPIINDGRLDHLSGQRKTYASEILYIDDNVGRIVDKLSDPNDDGDTVDSILDETMIVFINDNGGATQNSASNGDLRGSKGDPYDGGTRVPMFISGAGVDPSAVGTTFEKLVHSVDIVPTMVAAAGGSIAAGEIDGVNLLPFINGQDTSDPRTYYAQRLQEESYYRTTDWKLVKNGYAGDWELYDFSDINNQSEDPADDVAASNPAQLATMLRLMTDWEVTIDKQRFPSTDEAVSEFNLFDDFTFVPGSPNFSATNGWTGPGGAATMRDRDSHNGTVFHFGVTNSSSYTANNDLRRMNQLDFIAHGFEFEGAFSGSSSQSATIGGLPVLLAKNLDGELPYIHLSSISGGGPFAPGDEVDFEFDLAIDTQLYHDLNITGDGTHAYTISGDMTEYDAGRTITKTGSAAVRFTGQVEATGAGYLAQHGTSVFEDGATLTGDLTVSSGATVQLDGAIDGNVDNAGTFVVADAVVGSSSVTVDLIPTLGDGDVDSRNTDIKGDQDSQVLVGSVSNATGAQVERVQRAMFSFDLTPIPDAANVTSATLTLEFDGNDASSNNNISGDLELYELTEDPVFSETGSENVDWNQRDEAGSLDWTTPGGTLGALLANVLNANLPNPTTTVQGDDLTLASLAAFVTAVNNNLSDNTLSFVLRLPGEEADAAVMTGDRDLYRFGSNESTGSSPALLSITFDLMTDTVAHVTGDYTQQATGAIQFDLRSTTDFDQLDVAGSASLDGALDVASASFTPALGDEFAILSAASLAGHFDNSAVTGTALGADTSLAVLYDATQVRLLATYNGDANGDGTVSLFDLNALGANFGATNATWQLGDFNYDGVVSLLDLNALGANFGSVGPSTPAANPAVPEPASLVLLGLGGLAVLRRR